MSAPQWKPGDVAMVQNEHGVWNAAILQVQPGGQQWVYGVAYAKKSMDWPARPLVVIDPEDSEQVDRLVAALMAQDFSPWNTFGVTQAQNALRSLIAPPKPEQPMGLGAVVEDNEGRRWVRHDNTPGAFPWVCGGRGVKGYSEINAVRVLSEGWLA